MAFVSKKNKLHSVLRLWLISLTILWLHGCSTAQNTRLTEVDSANDAEASSGLHRAVSSAVEKDLDANTLALLLQAELSAYSGEFERAGVIYGRIAQETLDPELAKRYAEVAAASGDLHVLLDATLLWYELSPEDEGAKNLAIQALGKVGETQGAWELIAEDPDNHLAVQVLAVETRRAEFTSQMQWLYQAINDQYGSRPTSSELLLSLTILAEGLRLLDAAESYAIGAVAADPVALLPTQLHASILMQQQRTNEAVQVVSEYASNKNASQEDRTQIARLLASIDQEAAVPVFTQLADEFPWSPEILLGAGQLLLSQNQLEESEKYFMQLSQIDEQSDLAHFNLGRISEQRGQTNNALDYYYRVGEGELEFEAKLRAALLVTAENPQPNASQYDALFNRFPERAATIYHEQGRALADADRPELALQVFSEGLSEFPNNTTLLYARSVTYESEDRIEEAVTDLRTVLATDNQNVTAMNALGYTLANRTDRYSEAHELIEQALALRPEDPAIIDSMGWVLYRMGRYEESLQYLERAYAAFFDEEIISHLAQVLVALDRVDEAKTLIDDSLELLPESQELQRLDLRLQNPDG